MNEMSTSLLIPVINETDSLRETIDILLGQDVAEYAELLFLVAERTTPESMAILDEARKNHGEIIRIHKQSLPHLGGAIREGFDVARGTHVLLMASDLETDPHLVPAMIETARQTGADIVCTTRWTKGGTFQGYHPLKQVLNFVFQKFFSALYGTRLTDLTFGFRLYNKEVLRGQPWAELKHAFLFESLVRPLVRGARAVEIPTHWTPRPDGESSATFAIYWGYFRVGFKVRFGRSTGESG
jgi:glycosyltransferase involved in cell wall biosynthesis